METIGITQRITDERRAFFETVFRSGTGFLCLANKQGKGKELEQRFFKYPEELDGALEYVTRTFQGRDVYYCAQLLTGPTRTKAYVGPVDYLWSDLDTCAPSIIDPPPSVVVETSPGRYHGVWLLTRQIPPHVAEDYSRRIAYRYEAEGADTSGWDRTQLLRVPQTYNIKRGGAVVRWLREEFDAVSYDPDRFLTFPKVKGWEWASEPFPDVIGLKPDVILHEYRSMLDARVHMLYSVEPSADWSASLWFLENLLCEAGMSAKEAFVVAQAAACNKYERDGRDNTYLWYEVCKAYADNAERGKTERDREVIVIPNLEPNNVPSGYFTDKFVTWGTSRSDAAHDFFVAGGLTILSALLCDKVVLETNYGTLIPNLWFMLTGSSTIDRKTTAMSMAMRLLREIDEEAILATDGSIEGILSALQVRPNRAGVFFRDEFSGLLAATTKKDYLAGMLECFTQLYDGEYQKRVLRKEIIEIRDPRLVLLCGGIFSRIMEALTIEHITSGFLPRFLFVNSPAVPKQRMAVGPRTSDDDKVRDGLISFLEIMRLRYEAEDVITVAGMKRKVPRVWKAQLTTDTWAQYNDLEDKLVTSGLESGSPEKFVPLMDRMAKSTLKATILLAASRQNPHDHDGVIVEQADLNKAQSYMQPWLSTMTKIVENIGINAEERKIGLVYEAIRRMGTVGVARSELMRLFHLRSREADVVFETLDQRSLVVRVRRGRSEWLYDARASRE